jgi:nitroimidazol reductase NimA-like FMN-containing flavoprotein (pyridoxamine 5'-phosphate oxidase superfamily)
MEGILDQEEIGVLCMSREDEPYGVPISYARIGGEIVFHTKKTGRKLDCIRANPRVCLAVSRNFDRTRPHHPNQECEYAFESVVCFGRARIVEQDVEKLDLLRRFKAHFDEKLGLDASAHKIPKDSVARVAIVSISVDEMTGRRQGPK